MLILGAGMAGMSAAVELIKLGHDVTILEGQMRAGGRIKTERSSFANGLYADMGAARIPEDHEWTMKYIKEYNLKLHPFNPTEGKYIHIMKGKKISYTHDKPADINEYPLNLTEKEKQQGWEGLGNKPLEALLANIGDAKSLNWPPANIAQYDKYSLKEYFEQAGYSREVADLLMIGWETEKGMSMSVLETIRELSLSFGAVRNKIVGGNDLLPTKMAETLSGSIQYGVKVLDLSQTENEVAVTINKGGEHQTLAADRVICTFPLTVVKKLPFVKNLSKEKQKAIQELTYWDLSRTVVQVKERNWKKEGYNGFAATDRPMEIWDPNYESDSTRGLIAAYIKNDDSQLYDKWTDAERYNFSVDQLEKVFPGVKANAEGGYTKCWKEDPWALGAHSIGTRGQMTQVLPHLIKPEGRIHFAGEHASAYHGWIQGAIESGNRAAKEINSIE